MKFTLLFLLFVFCLVNYHKCDIPTHCLTSQVHGKWKFKATALKQYNSLKSLYTLKCGITNHRVVDQILKQKMNPKSFTNSFDVDLKPDMTAVMQQKGKKFVGRWTLLYDEGILMEFGEKNTPNFQSYFVFLKFDLNKRDFYISKCYESMIGWYHKGSKNWGCFKGHKDVNNYSVVTNFEVANKMHVVEGGMKKASFLEFQSIVDPNLPRFKEKESISSSSTEENKAFDCDINDDDDQISFLSMNSKVKNMNQKEMVKKINSMNLGWEAKEYEEFEGMNYEEIHEEMKNGKINFGENKKEDEKEGEKRRRSLSHTEVDKTMRVEYRKYLGGVKSQKKCGSCYATSTLSMIEARFNIKNKALIDKYFAQKGKKFELSANQVLDCSWTNQGCKGGYSTLTSKYFNEYGILPETCYVKNKCHTRCAGKNNYLNKLDLKVTDYYFVGGFYGATNEDNMLIELQKNGPFVVSIKTVFGFYNYYRGIFSMGSNKRMLNKEWQNVNHSILLVGYGVESDGTEYWEIMNSWNTRWGNKGFAKIKKGDNIMSIESLGEAAKVEISEI